MHLDRTPLRCPAQSGSKTPKQDIDLIEERPASQSQSEAMKALIQLKEKIARIKSDRIAARVAEIQAFLAEVRKSDAEQYARVADALRSALAAEDV